MSEFKEYQNKNKIKARPYEPEKDSNIPGVYSYPPEVRTTKGAYVCIVGSHEETMVIIDAEEFEANYELVEEDTPQAKEPESINEEKATTQENPREEQSSVQPR